MNKIAIITVFNKPDLFNQMQRTVSDTAGDISYQIIGLDNVQNHEFSSAASAYNYAIKNCCDAEVYIFCHQDILFMHTSIKDIYERCMGDRHTLYGAAGVKNVGHGNGDKNRIITSMGAHQDGDDLTSLQKGAVEDVFSLDECLICGHRSIFEEVQFDEDVCEGWHLYATELCLQCHVKGINVKVFDADIVHLSGGNPDKSFYETEKKIVKKYRKTFRLISYTCGWAYTDPFRYYALSLYRKFRYGI